MDRTIAYLLIKEIEDTDECTTKSSPVVSSTSFAFYVLSGTLPIRSAVIYAESAMSTMQILGRLCDERIRHTLEARLW